MQKINALYDVVDILATSKYISDKTKIEESYKNPQTKPKNRAHEGIKYWYKFQNDIVFDGIPYFVTFNIRDKGNEQYQYLIEFKENKTPGLSNTVFKKAEDLLRTDRVSNSRISHSEQKVNTFDKDNYPFSEKAKKSVSKKDIEFFAREYKQTTSKK